MNKSHMAHFFVATLLMSLLPSLGLSADVQFDQAIETKFFLAAESASGAEIPTPVASPKGVADTVELARLYAQARGIAHSVNSSAELARGAAISGKTIEELGRLYNEARQVAVSVDSASRLASGAAISGKSIKELGQLYASAQAIAHSVDSSAELARGAAISGKTIEELGRLYNEARQVAHNVDSSSRLASGVAIGRR